MLYYFAVPQCLSFGMQHSFVNEAEICAAEMLHAVATWRHYNHVNNSQKINAKLCTRDL